MTKEIPPKGEKIEEINLPREYLFLTDGTLDKTLEHIKDWVKSLDSEDDTIKEEAAFYIKSAETLLSELKAKFIEMTENEGKIIYKSSRGTKVNLSEWKTNISKIEEVLYGKKSEPVEETGERGDEAGTAKIVDEGEVPAQNTKKETPLPLDLITIEYKSVRSDLEGYLKRLNHDHTDDTIKEIEVFLSKQKDILDEAGKQAEEKGISKTNKTVKSIKRDNDLVNEIEAKIKSLKGDVETPTESDEDKEEAQKEESEIRSLGDLPGGTMEREVKPLSDYDSLILDFIKSSKNKEEYIKNRNIKFSELMEEVSNKPEDEREIFINKHVSNIQDLIRVVKINRLENGLDLIDELNQDILSLQETGPSKSLRGEIENYEGIKDQVFAYGERLEKERSKDLEEEVIKFIEKSRANIGVYTQYIKHGGDDDGVTGGANLLKNFKIALRELDRLENFVKNPTNANTRDRNGEEKKGTRTKTKGEDKKTESVPVSAEDMIDILDIIGKDLGSIAILKSNPELEKQILAAIKNHKRFVEEKARPDQIYKAFQKIEKVRKDWSDYKTWFNNERKGSELPGSKKKDKTKRNVVDGLSEKDLEGEDIKTASRYINSLNKPEPEIKTETTSKKVGEFTSSMPVPEEFKTVISPDTFGAPKASEETIEVKTVDVTEPASDIDTPEIKSLSLEELVEIDGTGNYSEIVSNNDFNLWLRNIYNSLKIEGRNNIFEQDHISNWYAKYQASLPYYKKLLEIRNETIKADSAEKSLLADSKINALMFSLYDGSEASKAKIDAIYEAYKHNRENSEKIKQLKEFSALKDDINKKREEGKQGSLRTDQVKRLLEAGEEDIIPENISDLKNFLLDMNENYDFYSKGVSKEEEGDSIRKVVVKFLNHNPDNADNNPETEEGEKRGWFKGTKQWFKRRATNIKSVFGGNASPEELNRYSPLILELRRQNLVERKGKKDTKLENEMRMRHLIDMIRDKGDVLEQYIANPESVDISGWEDTDKKSLEIFRTLYKAFSEQKYRGGFSKSRADSVLKETDSLSTIHSLESGLQTAEDILLGLDTEDEIKELRKKAVYESGLAILDSVEQKINKFGKQKNLENAKKIITELEEAEKCLTADDSIEDEDAILKIKKTKLKLAELIISNTNKNKGTETLDSLKSYDVVLSSPETTKEVKVNYLQELIAALKLHLKNPANNPLQNMVLNAKIKEYTSILNSL